MTALAIRLWLKFWRIGQPRPVDRTFFGGPWHGRPVEIKDGWPDPDRLGHGDFKGEGDYVRTSAGLYRWEPAIPH